VPSSSETTVALPAHVALHARPAADLVRTAIGFDADVFLIANGRRANAKSLIGVLALGATGGTELTLRGDGQDAHAAIVALSKRITGLVE
jgi:phosphotransferase system HPr (HPr) family protein